MEYKNRCFSIYTITIFFCTASLDSEFHKTIIHTKHIYHIDEQKATI